MDDPYSNTLSIDERSPDGVRRNNPHLLLLLECERPSAGSSRHSLCDVDEVVVGRGEERSVRRDPVQRRLDLRVPDPRMSSRHARLVRHGRNFVLEDLGSKNGTLVNGARQTEAPLADGDLIELGYSFLLFRDALPENEEPDSVSDVAAANGDGLVSLVPDLAEQLEDLRQIATSTLSVLVLGESGTGKELIARGLHRLSGRSGPFMAINCGAIAENLVESELFGYRKGAFSGAQEDRTGLIRAAHGGTLFLDEIGDLPPSAQAALLRTLQEREVMPVGATKSIPVDIRVVAATHRDIEALAGVDRFRADLLARLRGFAFRLAPLRRRREDFGLILGALTQRVADRPLTFSPEAMRSLLRHSWPLNIRELEQCVVSSAALASGRIYVEHLPDSVRLRPGAPLDRARAGATPGKRVLSQEEQLRRARLLHLFEKHQGNISAVARELGKDRVQIRRWIRLYEIDLGRAAEE